MRFIISAGVAMIISGGVAVIMSAGVALNVCEKMTTMYLFRARTNTASQ